MEVFLENYRDELIDRCKAKVARRPFRAATGEQLKNGVPLFLEQLRRTLVAEARGQGAESISISGISGGDVRTQSEMGASAAAHGKQLLELGYSVDQVVHDYGDLCQAITDLAAEVSEPFSVDQFRTLNRCLDNAIADAVTEFSLQRELNLAREQSAVANRRLGFLVHELRNATGAAKLAYLALRAGGLPVSGATGSILGRSLDTLALLLEDSLDEVKIKAETAAMEEPFSLLEFVKDICRTAELEAAARGCKLTVGPISEQIGISGNRENLSGALVNILQNALKFTRPGTGVSVQAYAAGERVFIDVEDHCGGLPAGQAAKMFSDFSQFGANKKGLGLGLSIARQNLEADAGSISVTNKPGKGCVFTLCLPRRALG